MKHILSINELFENYTNSGKFYINIDDYTKIFNNMDFLKFGVLKGIKGISSSPYISDSLGTGCEIFFEMKEADVLEKNDLQRVDYENADDLVKNNFELLKRVMALPNTDNKYFMEMIFYSTHNLEELKEIANDNSDIYNFFNTNIKSILKNDVPNIDSIKDLTEWVLKYKPYDELKLSSVLYDYICSLVVNYESEEEWIVNGDFNVPSGSTIKVYSKNILNFKDIKKDFFDKCDKYLFKYKVLFY